MISSPSEAIELLGLLGFSCFSCSQDLVLNEENAVPLLRCVLILAMEVATCSVWTNAKDPQSNEDQHESP